MKNSSAREEEFSIFPARANPGGRSIFCPLWSLSGALRNPRRICVGWYVNCSGIRGLDLHRPKDESVKQSACLTILCFFVLLLSPSFGADGKPPVAPARPATEKIVPAAAKVTTMKTAGVLTEITEQTIKIERAFKGKKEIMEFGLERPVEGLAVGDKVSVNYREKGGRYVAFKVAKMEEKKLPPRKTPVPGKAAGKSPPREKSGTR